jgi:hypothetical protein
MRQIGQSHELDPVRGFDLGEIAGFETFGAAPPRLLDADETAPLASALTLNCRGIVGTGNLGPLVADFLVERRGFEPLTSVVQAPARLTGSSLPFLRG